MSNDQDAADVGAVLAGNLEAFERIVRRWQGPLVTLAFRFCRDRHQAEEMAQTAFVKAYESLRQWRGSGAFSSWLFALATNVYRSEIRRRRPPMAPLDAALDAGQPRSATSRDGSSDQETVVRHAVSTLPGKYRDTFVLFYFHGMNVRETAESLGLAQGTVKARLHRGRTLLRKELGSMLESTDPELRR